MMQNDYDLADLHWKHDLLGSIEVGIVVLDRDYNVQVWNQFMENHSSVVPSQIKGKSLFEFFPEIDEEWFKIKSEPAFNLRSPVFVIWEQRPYLFRFGSNRPVTSNSDFMYQNVTVFPLASLSGIVDQICIVIYDVTDEAISRNGMNTLNKQLQQISRVDGLTGLYNRRFWEEQFDLEYKRGKRSDNPSSLIMLDIDHFKQVNDTYGHPAGDEVIRSLADVIKKATRETDLNARYGGEEFVILLTETPEKNVHFVAERIRKLVEESIVEYEGLTIKYTVSLGMAGFRADYKDSTAWLDYADKALYKAKESGRNKVVVA
jgi:diguanylate cyclase (GGDEF)-like protein